METIEPRDTNEQETNFVDIVTVPKVIFLKIGHILWLLVGLN